MVTVTFPVFYPHSLTCWLAFSYSFTVLFHLASFFSSPLLASLASWTPSFYAEPLLVSVICFSPPLPVAGVKCPSLSLTSEHFSSLEDPFGLWGLQWGHFSAPVVPQHLMILVTGKAHWRHFLLHPNRDVQGWMPPWSPSPLSGKFNLGKVSSRPLLWAGFAEQKPISLQC